MPNLTTCSRCAGCYEAGSSEQADERGRICFSCRDQLDAAFDQFESFLDRLDEAPEPAPRACAFPCSEPGCGALTYSPIGRCATHGG